MPLLVKFPDNSWAGRRVAQQVQGLDIVPTVLEALGVPLASDLAGVPLQRVVRGETQPRPALAEISHRGFVAHGVRTEQDKYVRRFSPDDDQLYFELERDPGERVNRALAAPQRVRQLEQQAEAGMAQNPFRYVLQLAGSGRFALRLETRGWLEGVETTGFGSGERFTIGGNGRWLDVAARPRAGTPRELAFTVRPIGAPVLLSGTRDGRALRAGDVAIGETAFRPRAFPLRLPDIESETEADRGLVLFRPPRPEMAGVRIWLQLPQGRTLQELDAATRERLQALGYVGPG